MNVEETLQFREGSTLKIHPAYLEDSCIIHLMYLEFRDSSNVLGRFVNIYIMVIMISLWKPL